MSFLRFYEGAKPGQKRKQTDNEKKQKAKEYESKRPPRSFQESWKAGRDWLDYDREQNKMFCKVCKSLPSKDDRKTLMNPFIKGCNNFRTSCITDHENSKPHKHAALMNPDKPSTATEVCQSHAGAALKLLHTSERHRLKYLFRNAHAVAKQNRPMSDYVWLCQIDRAKEIDIGSTYINDHAAVNFIHFIAKGEHAKTVQICENAPYLSFMMDGTTDISGSEQETMYVRTSLKGKVSERFLNMSSPLSTKSEDLYDHVIGVLTKSGINKGIQFILLSSKFTKDISQKWPNHIYR